MNPFANALGRRLIVPMKSATLPEPPKAPRLWTYDEMVAELPESNLPMELWEGELIMSPTPTPSHQRIVMNLLLVLNKHVETKGAGTVFVSPLDVVLTQRRVVQPDLFFVATTNQSIIQDRIRGVPDLTVEIISPGTRKRDRVERKALYQQAGVKEYWLVDPENQTIEVFALVKGEFQLHSQAEGSEVAKSKLLTGFKVSFRELQA